VQTIYGEREHRAARRALRVEAVRAVAADVALALLLLGSLVVAGVCR
jgi:hypothetical protein